ncbi:hypothetical protein W02_16550 [Nitrospira sp. KM1]|nr:hypothetical protein W02_16550 [Nitrospira sp. KM1]
MGSINAQLVHFGRCIRAITEWLDLNPTMNAEDKLMLENYIQILQLAYAGWGRRQREMTPRK